MQNFRPGVIDAMGLGETVIRGINPEIVYVSISGFGESGPYADKRAYDPVIQALTGLADIQAASEHDRPRMVRTVIPDKTTGLAAAQAITAALLARERSGRGQHVRIAMLDTMIAYLWPEGLRALTAVGHEHEVRRGQVGPDLVFETADGYITAGAVSDKEWRGLCAALEHPQWLEDERFRTAAGRFRYVRERLEQTGAVLRERTTADWLKRLHAHGVPCAPVLTRREVIDHEQVRANGMLFEYDHPGLGRVRQPRAAARFDLTPTSTCPVAPGLGEHTRNVLAQAGYDAETVAQLIEQGIVVST